MTRSTRDSGASERTSTSQQQSTNCVAPSSDSKPHWHKPTTIKEFAAQANEIATLVLNEAIDMEKAKTYAGLARIVVQSASIEVARSRFNKSEPDLTL